jgi:hypothetical protein
VRFATLRSKYAALAPVFTERSRRLWAATEARALGLGGIGWVERATRISRATIQRGLLEPVQNIRVDAKGDWQPGAARCYFSTLIVTSTFVTSPVILSVAAVNCVDWPSFRTAVLRD